MNHLPVLESFFHCTAEGDLVRDKNPKGGWLSSAKDVRLARGYVLRATCRRRFLGYRSSLLELSEREVSDSIGPHAIRIAREEGSDVLLARAVQIPLTQKNVHSLDGFIGNDDGILVRALNGGDFSKSASDVTLSRATLLVASLPKAAGGVGLCIVSLDDVELDALKAAVEAEREWKRKMEEKAKNAADAEKESELKAAQLEEIENKKISQSGLFSCCFPRSSKNPAASNEAANKKARASQRGNTQVNLKVSNPQIANSANQQPIEKPVVEIGTPSIPTSHRDSVDRIVRQTAQAAASETWDPSWRRVGSHDGLTWLLKEGGKMVMVRGTIHAPARSVFEYVWSDSANDLCLIEPRVKEVRLVEKDIDGTGHTKTQFRTSSPEWAYASGISEESDLVESTCLRHYHVHPDGTIFIVELNGQETAGIVISPVQDDDLSCYVAWVETPYILKRTTLNNFTKLAPWASSRLGAITAKLLGDRLHALSKFGMSRKPYSDFEDALRRGKVVNHNGSSGATVKHSKSTGTSLMKEKMREFDELAVTSDSISNAEARQLVQNQISAAMEAVLTSIPDERKKYRAGAENLKTLLNDLLSSNRAAKIKTGAQYPFDCILMWIITALPTEETWVEVLAEKIAMRNVEAQTTYGRRVDHVNDPEGFNRISQILSKERDRPPSL